MTDHVDSLRLMVHIPADDWAYAKRRIIYLEAVLVRLLSDRSRIKEWYDAGELHGLRLPGLPGSRAAITRAAKDRKWLSRPASGKGSRRLEYHYSSFPPRAFDALVGAILDLPPGAGGDDAPPEPDLPSQPPAARLPDNAAPAWVLPFMRLLKGGADGDIGAAWRALPDHLPNGVTLPTEEDAADMIVRLGLIGDF